MIRLIQLAGRCLRYMTRCRFVALSACLFAGCVFAQPFPNHTVTVVVPYPAGGAADMFGRTIAQALEEALKQTVIVENRPGAGGSVGMTYVARAKPDGYTIALGTIGTQSINQFIYPALNIDPVRDFEPIALVSTTPNVVSVSVTSPWKNLQDVIDAARAAKDKKLTYGTPGIGSSPHLTAEYFAAVTGVELLHIPFKGVSGSFPALVGGQIDLLFDNLPGTVNQINEGNRIRGIALTSAERSPLAPNLPTFTESGVKGFDVTAWFAIYAPKGTPKDVMDVLIEAARKGLKSEKIIKTYAAAAANPGQLFGPELAAFEQSERAKWGKLIKDKGIKSE